MPTHIIRAAIAVVSGMMAPGMVALDLPPSDAGVKSAIAHYLTALSQQPDDQAPAAVERLREDLFQHVNISKASPSQLAMVYKARAFQLDERRDRVVARLAEFADDQSPAGAAAAVLRLELLGGTFVIPTPEGRKEYRPTSEAKAELLKRALDHPALGEAVMNGDEAACMIFSAVSGLADRTLWRDKCEQILGLQSLLTKTAPARLLLDSEDYLIVVRQCAGDSPSRSVQAIRAHIVECGGEVVRNPKPGDLNEDELNTLNEVLDRLRRAAAKEQLIGFPAPRLDFKWSSPGELHSLDDLKGKVVVLDFWTTFCGPCIASFPKMRELQVMYDKFDVAIIGVTSLQGKVNAPDGITDCADNPARELELMRAYMHNKQITWTVAFSKQSAYNPDYGIRGIPHMAIIDPDGKVRFNGLHPAAPLHEKVVRINAILDEFRLPAPSIDVPQAATKPAGN